MCALCIRLYLSLLMGMYHSSRYFSILFWVGAPAILRIDPLPPCARVDVVSDTPVGSLGPDPRAAIRYATPGSTPVPCDNRLSYPRAAA